MLLISVFARPATATCDLEETELFIEIDSHWKHNESGDAFVVRADVTNIGDNPAICVHTQLEEIPKDWVVCPTYHKDCRIQPGETIVRYFIIERDEIDETIYASASALNADKIISSKIAIPIFPGFLLILGIACGIIVHRDIKKRKNEIKIIK